MAPRNLNTNKEETTLMRGDAGTGLKRGDATTGCKDDTF